MCVYQGREVRRFGSNVKAVHARHDYSESEICLRNKHTQLTPYRYIRYFLHFLSNQKIFETHCGSSEFFETSSNLFGNFQINQLSNCPTQYDCIHVYKNTFQYSIVFCSNLSISMMHTNYKNSSFYQ